MSKKKLTFEEAKDRIEEIVAALESGEIGLEESVARYGEGRELIQHCRRILDEAERKIQVLTNPQADDLEPAGELEEPEEPNE